MKLDYPFTETDSQRAFEEWGCNCGPSALAFALRCQFDAVRPLIPHFDERRYTSPKMMAAALHKAGRSWQAKDPLPGDPWGQLAHDRPTLLRIQWTGPWTAPGANPKWAYRQTHWICGWLDWEAVMVFDINGGIRTAQSWEKEVVPPLLKACVPRADGGWYPTDCWQIDPSRALTASR